MQNSHTLGLRLLVPLVLLSSSTNVLCQSLLPAEQTEKAAHTERGGDSRPRLPLLVSNFAQVELPVLVEAEAVATQIFAEAGVEAIWTNCPDHQECGGEKKGPELRIRILSKGKGIVTHDALGFAIPCDRRLDPCRFYVFYAPINDLAERHHVRPGHVLGQVITHEVGHALLSPNAHAVSGIMQARLPNADLEHMLYFTPGEAMRMRTRLLVSSRANLQGPQSIEARSGSGVNAPGKAE